MKKILTTCPYCGTGCNFHLQVENDQIIGVTPANGNSVNNGSLCAKGHFGFDFVRHPHRLTSPLVRKNGVLVETDWDEAFAVISNRFKSFKKDFGPDSIAGFSSARCTNEENYLMQKFMRAAIGTNNVDHCARL